MLRVVTGTPRYTTVFVAVCVEIAVPSIENVTCKVFCLSQVFCFTGVLVSPDELTCYPHLVIVHVLDARHRGRAYGASTVYSVHAPLAGLRVRREGIGALVVAEVCVELRHLRLVACEVGLIQLGELVLGEREGLHHGVGGLQRGRVWPHISRTLGTLGTQIIDVAHAHSRSAEAL